MRWWGWSRCVISPGALPSIEAPRAAPEASRGSRWISTATLRALDRFERLPVLRTNGPKLSLPDFGTDAHRPAETHERLRGRTLNLVPLHSARRRHVESSARAEPKPQLRTAFGIAQSWCGEGCGHVERPWSRRSQGRPFPQRGERDRARSGARVAGARADRDASK